MTPISNTTTENKGSSDPVVIREKVKHAESGTNTKSTVKTVTTSWESPQQDPEYIRFLFESVILDSVETIKSMPELKAGKKIVGLGDAVDQSRLFRVLRGITAKLIPISMETFLSAVLELRPYYHDVRKKEVESNAKRKRDDVINAITRCMERLVNTKVWTHEEPKNLNADLLFMQEKANFEEVDDMSGEEEESSPIDLLINKVHDIGYVSADIQDFIKTMVTSTQLKPLLDIVQSEKLSDDEKYQKLKDKCSKFFTKTEKNSFALMSNPWHFLRIVLSIVKPEVMEGAKHFQENTVATAAAFLRSFQKLHLQCFERKLWQNGGTEKLNTARGEKKEGRDDIIVEELLKQLEEAMPDDRATVEATKKVRDSSHKKEKKAKVVAKEENEEKERVGAKSEKKVAKQKETAKAEPVIDVVDKHFTIGNIAYYVSFALEVTKEKKVVKAITVNRGREDDGFDDESSISGQNQEVYLFVQHVQNPNDPPDANNRLSKLPLYKIEQLPNTNSVHLKQEEDEVRDELAKLIEKSNYECTVHTALKHEEQTMLVEIIWQIGKMLSVRGLLGEIKSFVNGLDPNKYDCISELEGYATAGYVWATNEYLDQFYRDSFFKRQNVESKRSVEKKTTGVSMRVFRDDVIHKVEEAPCGFDWLLRSICATFYDPDGKLQTKRAAQKQTLQKGLQLNEPLELLQTALEKRVSEKAIIGVVDSILMGLYTTINRANDPLPYIKKCFKEYEGFPKKAIEVTLGKDASPAKKAMSIFVSLFNMESLGLKKAGRKKEIKAINSYLVQFVRRF